MATSPRAPPMRPREDDFYPCNNPFYSQLPTVKEADNWLTFPLPCPLTRQSKLFVRSSYTSIAEQALASVGDPSCPSYSLITGTTGTGKSVFLFYLLWRLMQQKQRVLLVTEAPAIYYDGHTVWDCGKLPSPRNRSFWSPDLCCLIDRKAPTRIAGFPLYHCSVLFASALGTDAIREFRKLAPPPAVYYMPLWTRDELAAVAPLYPSSTAVWQTRWHSLGGVPRLVLQDVQDDPHTVLLTATRCCSLEESVFMLSIDCGYVNGNVHTLIHANSQAPYRTCHHSFASDLAMQVVARYKWLPHIQQLINCHNPLAQTLCGYLLDPATIESLEEDGFYVPHSLETNASE